MRRGVFVFIVAVLLATSLFCGYRWFACREARALAAKADAEMEWLRREFELNDEEFSRVAALHEAYRPKCDALCRAVVEANAKLHAAMSDSPGITPEVASALQNASESEQECRRALLGHIYAVSAEMKPDAAGRYMAMMKPRIVRSAETHHRTMTSERR